MMRRIWWLLAVAAVAGCGDDFVGPCVPDDAGKGCDGGTSPDGGGAAGQNSGTSGTGSTNDRDSGSQADTGIDPMDDDAGDMPPPEMDAAIPMDAAEPTPDAGSDAATNPPEPDGTQLAPCEAFEEGACAEGLGCYVRGNGPGFCTATCEDDEDCEALTDAEYTCSTSFGGGQGPGGGGGLCRIECEGENDTESCPDPLVCISVGGGGQGNGGQGNGGAFRCGYADDPTDPGDGTVARWGRCTESDECAGNLVCYSTFQENADGFCTDTCENNDDCSEDPGSGDIDPTCGTQNECRFDCAEGGTCPDGMECIADRCTYPAQ